MIAISASLLTRRRRGRKRDSPRRPAPLQPGSLDTVGRYEIHDLLGAGEVTTTWKGFDAVLHRDVVVKLLHRHLLDTSAARRMEREGRALARLDHPAIPSVIEIIQQPGVLALVEEYIAGESLAHILAERGALSLTETLPVIRTVASALDHAHQNGIVHHNVTPDNILVTFATSGEERGIYLLDFGLAAFYDDESLKALTPHGKLLGDPAYISPEQIRGKRGDHRSDVYSLGIVLYEMLTGENPFDTGIPTSTQFRQVNEEPPERPLAGLPRPVQAVIKKALRKAPDRRYQSTGELAEALAKAAGVEAAESLVQADTSRDPVIPTIHANQVLLVHHGQPVDGVPLMPAITDEDVSRVLAKDRKVCILQIYAFGGGRVVRDGCAVPASDWKGPQNKEMFFYILLHGPLTRDGIGVIFWPDSAAKKVEGRFHTALDKIRTAVGAKAVVMEEGKYRLGDITYWFDVEEFEALVIQARLLRSRDRPAEHLWGRAVALYQGDFLPEASRPWCVPRRELLRDMYVEALLEMGQCHAGRREFEEAIRWYKRALETNELREDVHRGIMYCYFEAGRRPEAIAQYHRCEEILEREMGVEPSAETVRLYEQIARKGKS